jgi:hypothetical protein
MHRFAKKATEPRLYGYENTPKCSRWVRRPV